MSTITRADALISNQKKPEFFSDFITNFAKTPIGNQLGKVNNERSINQALKNLILTNTGERLFQPYIGSNVVRSLFDLNGVEIINNLEFYIQATINNNEPRVNLIDISVTSPSEHELEITIVYNIINNPEPVSFSFLLRRVR
jgi:phage baseplate assembly protein W